MPALAQLDEMGGNHNATQTSPRVIIARDGTELADRLRATGWIVRAGWRTTSHKGQSVWNLCFELETGSGARS